MVWAQGLGWFVAGILAAFGGQLARGEVFYIPDHYIGSFAFQKFYWESFYQFGSFPLWNPYSNLGLSPLYNPAYGVLYPPHYLQLFLSPERYFQFGWVAHWALWVAGLVRWERIAFPYRRWLSLTPLVATSSLGLLFTTSNFTYLYALVWSVWILGQLARGDRSPAGVAKLALFSALLVTVGEPFSILVMGLFVAVVLLRVREFRLLAVTAAGVLVTGFFVFGPAYLALGFSTRAAGLSANEALAFSFHPARLLTLLSPYFFGYGGYRTFSAQSFTNDSPFHPRFYFDTLYLSLPLLCLILVGMVFTIRRRSYRLLAVMLFALTLAWGKWGWLAWAHDLFPFRFLRHPEKAMPLALLLATAFAFQSTVSWETVFRSRLTLGLLILGTIVPWLHFTHEYPIAILSAGGAISWLIARKVPTVERYLPALWVGIGLAQNFLSWPQWPLTPYSTLDARQEIGKAIEKRVPADGLTRYELGTGASQGYPAPHEILVGNHAIARRAVISGYEAFLPPVVEAIGQRLFEDQSPALTADELAAITQLTHLKLILINPAQSPPWRAMANQSGLYYEALVGNRALLLSHVASSPVWWFPRLAAGESVSWQWPPTVSKGREFWNGVERKAQEPPALQCQTSQPLPLPRATRGFSDPNRLALTFDAPRPGWIFLSQNLTPGWTLYQGSTQLPLRRLNGSFIGFWVPQGHFEGELRFRPWWALLHIAKN